MSASSSSASLPPPSKSISLGELPSATSRKAPTPLAEKHKYEEICRLMINVLKKLEEVKKENKLLSERMRSMELSLVDREYPSSPSGACSSSSSDYPSPKQIRTVDEARMAAISSKTGSAGPVEALKYYCRAVELSDKLSKKQQAQIYSERGLIQLELKRQREAEKDFRKAIELFPKLFEAYTHLIQLLLKQNKDDIAFAQASLVIKAAPEQSPERAKALYFSAKIHEKRGNIEKALEDLGFALEINPTSSETLTLRARIYLNHAKIYRAKQDVNACLEHDPKNDACFAMRGFLHLEEKKMIEAQIDINKAIGINRRNHHAYYYRAEFNYEIGNYVSALGDLVRISTKFKNDLNYQIFKARVLRKIAKPIPALEIINPLVEIYPENYWILALQGGIYADLGRFEKSQSILCKAMEILKDEPAAYSEMISLFVKQGKYNEALDLFNKGIEIKEYAAPDLLRQRGHIYLSLEKIEDAINDFAEAQKYCPDDPVLLAEWGLTETLLGKENLGVKKIEHHLKNTVLGSKMYALIGAHNVVVDAFDEALPHLNSALERNPYDILAHTYRGLMYLRSLNFQDAIDDFSAVLKQTPCDPYVHALIGTAYDNQGEKDKAEASYLTALMYNKDSRVAKTQLELLHSNSHHSFHL